MSVFILHDFAYADCQLKNADRCPENSTLSVLEAEFLHDDTVERFLEQDPAQESKAECKKCEETSFKHSYAILGSGSTGPEAIQDGIDKANAYNHQEYCKTSMWAFGESCEGLPCQDGGVCVMWAAVEDIPAEEPQKRSQGFISWVTLNLSCNCTCSPMP